MRVVPIFLLLLISFFSSAQQTKSVDFKTAAVSLRIDPEKREVSGEVRYTFEVLKPIDTIRIDAQAMQFTQVKLNGKIAAFANTGKQLLLPSHLKKGKNELALTYTAQPKQTMYFVNAGNAIQVWTQGQGKYTSHWLPSFDDVNEKVVFNMEVTFENGYEVIANGVLAKKSPGAATIQWSYRMEKPMSSYLLMLAIGKFEKQTVTAASGIPLDLFIETADAAKWEPTYRHSKTVFDFLETEIGVPYPWQVYKQVPVRDFLYAGMENTSATVFSRDFVVDDTGFNDRDYVNVNAHELAHQWFGDMVTAQSGKHHWLQEGFATYYALLAEKQVFGDDYFNWKLYETAEQLQQASKTDTVPLMNEKASSLTFYQKGAWALHVLRKGMGEANFRKAVKNYLEKYQFANVVTDDFLNEAQKVSNYDIAAFKKRWLESPGFEAGEAIALLKENAFMQRYFSLADLGDKPYPEKRSVFEDLMKSDIYHPVKEEILYQCGNVPFEEKAVLLRLAMQDKDISVRQAVAKTLQKIPVEFAAEYETLLDDASYVTQEIALNALWSQFPEKQKEVLDKTAGRYGLNDNNLRILWLTLALATKEYQTDRKAAFYDELLSYTFPGQESAVRQNAITKLLYLNRNDSNVLPYLVNLTTHHKWQATKFAREKIRELLKNKKHRTYFEELLPKLPENEKAQLTKLLHE